MRQVLNIRAGTYICMKERGFVNGLENIKEVIIDEMGENVSRT
jgi:hypothetical protein